MIMQVTIGSPERGLEFAELTSYPAENLLADPENVTYDALSLKRNTLDTYFNPRVGSSHTSVSRSLSCCGSVGTYAQKLLPVLMKRNEAILTLSQPHAVFSKFESAHFELILLTLF